MSDHPPEEIAAIAKGLTKLQRRALHLWSTAGRRSAYPGIRNTTADAIAGKALISHAIGPGSMFSPATCPRGITPLGRLVAEELKRMEGRE